MSNYLQLCQELRRECRIPGTGPSAVIGQVGQLLDMVEWTKKAWTELQGMSQSWRWMRSTFTLPTVALTDTYAYSACVDNRTSLAIARFSKWLPFDTDGTPIFMSYKTSEGASARMFLEYLDWGQFRSTFRYTPQNPGPLIYFTIDPQDNLVLGPAPDGIYTVTGDFQRSAQILSADADVPDMPSDYHSLIVYRAMEKYAGSLGSPEAMYRAKSEGGQLLKQLRRTQTPKLEMPAPIA